MGSALGSCATRGSATVLALQPMTQQRQRRRLAGNFSGMPEIRVLLLGRAQDRQSDARGATPIARALFDVTEGRARQLVEP